MATEYKIIKIRRGIEDNFIPSNLSPGELHITTDTGKVHYCYSAGSVKQLATIEQLQSLLNVSPEAYLALQQLISELSDETVLTGLLVDIADLQANKLGINGDSKDNTVSFTEATIDEDIVTGESHATLFGKIVKTLKTFRSKFTKIDTNTATIYSASSTYTVGTYCLYDGLLYKCNTAITVAETWTPSKWTQVNLGAENKVLNDNLAKKAIFCRAHNSDTAVSVSNATWRAIGTDIVDDGAPDFTIASRRIVFQKAGYITVTGKITFATNATGDRGIAIEYNGTVVSTSQEMAKSCASAQHQMTTTFITRVNAGDTMTLQAYQNSGGNLDLTNAWIRIMEVVD